MSTNPIVTDSSYVGLFYAYEGVGGFVMEQGVASTTISPITQLNRYDVTNSLQIKYDVRAFNTKLGLIKDSANVNILDTSFNSTFPNNTITLSASEFSIAVTTANIISVGAYSTAYYNFQSLINTYFGYPTGFTSLFSINSGLPNINNGIFDASAMVYLMHHSAQNASGEYVNTMTGNITINNANIAFC